MKREELWEQLAELTKQQSDLLEGLSINEALGKTEAEFSIALKKMTALHEQILMIVDDLKKI